MSTDLLFEHFDTLATAPDGIERLRELILQLALQGKLGTQDERDEPASILSSRINQNRKQLIDNRSISKSRNLPEIDLEEIPFQIPENWIWLRLDDIGHNWGQKEPDNIFTYIDVTAINKEKGIIGDDVNILRPEEAPSRARKIVRKGTVIYSTVRPYLLNIAIVDKDFNPEPIVSTAFAVIHPFEGISNRYLFYYLRSKPFIEYVESQMTGMAYPAINDVKFHMGLIPVPPLAEQHRIVEKVDRLMALCDELEALQQQERAGCLKLGKASLAGLQNAESPEEFERLWAQVCDAFELILDCPENVDILRQTILQLAVQGRLVRQDPDDEPGITLIEKIRRERKQQVKGRKIEFQQPLASIKEKKITYSIPATWIWIRLGETIESMANGIYKPEIFYSNDGIACLRMYNINSGEINFKNLKKMELTDREIDQYLLKKGDLLVNRVNSRELVGKAAVIPDLQEPMIFESKNIRVRFNNHLILPDFVNILFQTKDVLQSWQGKAKQTCGQASVSQPQIAEIYTPLPPLAEQYRIVEKVKTMMVLLDKLEKRLKEGFNIQNRLAEAFVIDIDYLN